MNAAVKLLMLGSLFTLSSCLEFPNKYSQMPPGMWRGVLLLDDPALSGIKKPLDEKSLSEIRSLQINEINSDELPFLFEVIYPAPDSFFIEIINGKERIQPSRIRFGRSLATAKDTIEIHFPEYRSLIKAIVEDRAMEGVFIDSSRGSYEIPFVAKQGDNYRFTRLQKKPSADISGEWAVEFGIDSDNKWPGVGQFEQEGNELSATFTTETGDYRFLEGCVQQDKFYLSAFDGSHAFMFEGKIFGEDSIIGVFKSGDHFETYWKAVPGAQALRDPFAILEINRNVYSTQQLLQDSFGIQAREIKNSKPVVLELMGTWCPNCKDASSFLNAMQKKYPEVQFIALAFERKGLESPEKHLTSYKKLLGLNYPVFYAGPASKAYAAQKLPFVEDIASFPSFFFMDASGKLVNSYSGFYGPATKEYPDQRKALMKAIDSISKN
ncbi:MAG TPA: TlpA disulfide reductase family protein [Saprospiraceae bacterium]|nr:TlpA disulfide reductase family protein [Saprospiraceae bacterium]